MPLTYEARIAFRNMPVLDDDGLLTPRKPPNWSTALCGLYVIAYSVYVYTGPQLEKTDFTPYNYYDHRSVMRRWVGD
jgi:hypothetical protein